MKVGIRKSSAKEFIAQPDPVGVDNIALAIFGNLADVTVAVVLLDLAASDPFWLTRQTHYAAQLVQVALPWKLNED